MRERYTGALEWCLDHRAWVAVLFGVFALGSLILAFVVGRDFFPYVDSGQMRLHVRAPGRARASKRPNASSRTIEREIRR